MSPEPVLQPQIVELVARLAEQYAGARGDLVRLAVPPRHATVEREDVPPASAVPPASPSPVWAEAWRASVGGPEFIAELRAGGSPTVVWDAPPGLRWVACLGAAVDATLTSGRGVLIVVPDGRDAARLSTELGGLVPDHVLLQADAGPAQRYRQFLSILRGQARVVVGTRAAAFAPVRDLGLIVVWDDGDDLHGEPRAPYPHVREVARLRAAIEGCGLLIGAHARSADAQVLLRTGLARELPLQREALRRAVTVGVSGATDRALERDIHARTSRLPQEAMQLIRAALVEGPVLVQTPRQGYAASLACERCRTPARCGQCTGPLRLASPTSPPGCGWCGHGDAGWSCTECGHRGLRASVVGETRTAEELGRAFPGARVITSGGSEVRSTVAGRPGVLVVATAGAEPAVGVDRQLPQAPESGYAAVILLDTWLMLARPDLRVREEALRRWLNAAALVRAGGRVLAVGDPADVTLQALVRWDPAGHAERELTDRASAHMPPACRVATLQGAPGAVDDAMTLLSVPPGAEVLGPADHGDGAVRTVIRVPWATGPALSSALGELQRVRSARKLDPVRIQVDPPTL